MTQLPVDIWWIILKKFWENNGSYECIPRKYNKGGIIFRSVLYDAKVIGAWVTSDLFLMRNVCKTTKKMVDKYSRRYVDGYEGNNKI
jgi:hypothetical protein